MLNLALATILVSACASATSKATFGSILALGDSWLDNGNGTFNDPLVNHTIPPDPSYWQGRFSNGPTWVEDLQGLLEAPVLLDYAYGGGTINSSIVQGHPGLSTTVNSTSIAEQITTFLNESLATVEPGSMLAVLSGGGNDFALGPPGLDQHILTDNLVQNVLRLADVGVKSFILTTSIVFNPFFNSKPELAAAAANFSDAFGPNVKRSLHAFNVSALPITVHLFDYRAALQEIADEADARGDNSYEACLQGVNDDAPQRSLCAEPDRYVFWDVFHPTKVTHQKLAQRAALFLA